MADVNAIINIDINSSSALLNLKRLESQIDQFNRSVSTSNATAAASQQSLNKALLDGINNTGLFTSKIVPVESSMTRFSRSLDEGRLSLGEYSRHAASQMPGLSRLFKREFDSIEQVATSRVKSMQTQYLALGKTVDGVTRAIASTPTGLGRGMATDLAMTQQRQQIFNKLLDDGSTKLLNWGKNTQWAGRQLMVGFSLPLAAFGAAAAKTFMEIDKATISLKRVYGDLSTTKAELDSNVESVKGLGREYTKYGITLAETIDISARAAATGATNEGLMAATEQTLRFATLGQMDYNQALDTTISLQTAFAISNEDLGKTVDYLNAVENQTILTMEDMSVAIPRVATVVKGLGGNVEDLAIMMTAMREGGVSAENAANGLKSGLASLINPTKRASESLASMGVNLNSIITQNKGDLMGIITEFGTAINKLDEFSRQQVLEQVFGKFQYARMSALFTNITKDAGQAARAMDLAGMSAADLAKISEKELGQISDSTSVKFQASMEKLKMSIAPIGEAFLKGITPIVDMVSKVADAFNNLPDGVKNAMAVITGVVAGLGPVLLMTIGLLGNGIANITKFVQFIRKSLAGIKGDASAFTYLAQGELEAVTASKALEGSSVSLTDKLLLQRGAVSGLTAEYERFARAAGLARAEMGSMGGAPVPAGGGRAPVPAPRIRRNTGGTIPGVGSTDTVPAMLTPGEFVINKESTARNLPLLRAINDGQNVGGFNKGGQIPGVQYFGGRIRPGGQVERIREKLKSAAKYLPPLPVANDPSTFLHLIKEQGIGGKPPEIISKFAEALGVTPRRMSQVGIDVTSGKDINRRLNVAELGGIPSGGHVTGEELYNAIMATQASKSKKKGKDPFKKIRKLNPEIAEKIEEDLMAWLKGNPEAKLNDTMISDVVMRSIDAATAGNADARTKFLSTGGYRLGRGIGITELDTALNNGKIERYWREEEGGVKTRKVAVQFEDGRIFSYETRNISTSEGLSQTGGKNYREFANYKLYKQWAKAQDRVPVVYHPKQIQTLNRGGQIPRLNRGGQIPRLHRGGRFLGMPQKFNTKLEKELQTSTRLAQSGPGSQLPLSEFATLEQGIGGYSAAFPGLNGIYVDAAGRRVVYKSHPNFESAEAEMLSGRLMSSLFGLDSPSQVVVKRKHPVTGDTVFGVESEFDKMFAISETVEAGSGRQFTPSEAARQFISSGIRRDRDLQPANIRGNIVVDQGVAVTGVNDKGEPRAMAQGRVTTTNPRSVIEQLQVNAIMGKGGAKKFLAENLADIARSVGPEEFERLMVSVVSEARSKLNTSIDNLPTSESTKNMYRSILTKDFDELQATSWRSYYDHLESFTVPVSKQPTDAALKKLELARQESARSKSSIAMAEHNIVSSRLGLPTAWARGVFRNTGGPIFESQTKIVPGVGSTDTVPAMLTPGEFVINKQATRENLPLLHAINNGQAINRNKGGQIPSMQYFATPRPQRVVQSKDELNYATTTSMRAGLPLPIAGRRQLVLVDLDGTIIGNPGGTLSKLNPEDFTPIEKNISRIRELRNQGIDIEFVTARPPEMEELTRETLRRLGLDDIPVTFNDMQQQGKRDPSKMVRMSAPQYKVEVAKRRMMDGYDVSLLDDDEKNRMMMQQSGIYSFFNKGGQIPSMQYFATPRPQRVVQKPELPSVKDEPFILDPALFGLNGTRYNGFEERTLSSGLRILRNLSGDGKTVMLQMGKYQPFHVGHEELLNQSIAAARTAGSDFVFGASGSYGVQSNNPLSPRLKKKLIEEATGISPNMVGVTSSGKKLDELLADLLSEEGGYSRFMPSIGSDKVIERAGSDKTSDPYSGAASRAGFEIIEGLILPRDASTEVSNSSGTLLRELAMAGRFEEFAKLMPASISRDTMEEVYRAIIGYKPFLKRSEPIPKEFNVQGYSLGGKVRLPFAKKKDPKELFRDPYLSEGSVDRDKDTNPFGLTRFGEPIREDWNDVLIRLGKEAKLSGDTGWRERLIKEYDLPFDIKERLQREGGTYKRDSRDVAHQRWFEKEKARQTERGPRPPSRQDLADKRWFEEQKAKQSKIRGYALGGPVTPMLAAAAANLSRLGFNRLAVEERVLLQSQQQASPVGMQLFRGVNAAADLVPEEIRQLALSGNVTDFSQLIGREIATPRGSWSSAFDPAAIMLGENSTARRLKELSKIIFPRRSSKKTAREILDHERSLGDNSPQIKAAKRKLDLAIKEGKPSSYISSLEAEYEKAKQAQRLKVQSLEQAVPEYENLMRSGASSSMIFDLTNVGASSGIGQGRSLINGITVDKDGVYRISLHSSGFDTVPISDISSFAGQERGIGGGNQFNEQEHFMFNKGGQIPQTQKFVFGGMAQSLKNKIRDLRTYLNLRHGAAPGVERIPLDPLSQSARDQQRNEDIYGPGIYHSDRYDTPQTYAGIPRPDGSYVYKGSSELGRMYSVSDVPGTIYRTSRNPRALLDFAKGKGFIHIDDIPDIFGSLEQQNLELRKMGYSGIIVPDAGARGESFIVDLVSGTQSYNALTKTNPNKPFRQSEMERMMAERQKNTQRKNTGGPIFESQSKIVPGVGSTDTVPAMLTPGEFVINKQSTRENLPLLHAINNGNVSGYAKGGQIPGMQYFATPMPQRVVQEAAIQQSSRGNIVKIASDEANNIIANNLAMLAKKYKLSFGDHKAIGSEMDSEFFKLYPELRQADSEGSPAVAEQIALKWNEHFFPEINDRTPIEIYRGTTEKGNISGLIPQNTSPNLFQHWTTNPYIAGTFTNNASDLVKVRTTYGELNKISRPTKMGPTNTGGYRDEEVVAIDYHDNPEAKKLISTATIVDKKPYKPSLQESGVTGADYNPMGIWLHKTVNRNKGGQIPGMQYFATPMPQRIVQPLSALDKSIGRQIQKLEKRKSLKIKEINSFEESRINTEQLARQVQEDLNVEINLDRVGTSRAFTSTKKDRQSELSLASELGILPTRDEINIWHTGPEIPNHTLLPTPIPSAANIGNLKGIGTYFTQSRSVSSTYAGNAQNSTGVFGFGLNRGVQGPTTQYGAKVNRKDFLDLGTKIDSKAKIKIARQLYEQAEQAFYKTHGVPSNVSFEQLMSGVTDMEGLRVQMSSLYKKSTDKKVRLTKDFDQDEYDAQMIWVSAVKGIGKKGVAHIGGDNMGGGFKHQVIIAYDSIPIKEALTETKKRSLSDLLDNQNITSEQVTRSIQLNSDLREIESSITTHKSRYKDKRYLRNPTELPDPWADWADLPAPLNKGGTIPGVGNTDKVPAMLTPGEFVINKKSTQSNLGLLHAINDGNTPQSMQGFNNGGQIPGMQYFADGDEVQSERSGKKGVRLKDILKHMDRVGATDADKDAMARSIIESEAAHQASKDAGYARDPLTGEFKQDQLDRAHNLPVPADGADKTFAPNSSEPTATPNWRTNASIENQTSIRFQDTVDEKTGVKRDSGYMKAFNPAANTVGMTTEMDELIRQMKLGAGLTDAQMKLQSDVFKQMLEDDENGKRTLKANHREFIKQGVAANEARVLEAARITKAIADGNLDSAELRRQAQDVLDENSRRNNRGNQGRQNTPPPRGPLPAPDPSTPIERIEQSRKDIPIPRAQEEQNKAIKKRLLKEEAAAIRLEEKEKLKTLKASETFKRAYGVDILPGESADEIAEERAKARIQNNEAQQRARVRYQAEMEKLAAGRTVDGMHTKAIRVNNAIDERAARTVKKAEKDLGRDFTSSEREVAKAAALDEAKQGILGEERGNIANREEVVPKKAGFFRSGIDAQGNKIPSRMARMAPGVHQASMGLGGGLMMASMAPMMMQDKEGKFLGMDPNMAMMGAMGAGTVVSMLPMLQAAAGPVAIALAAIAAIGVGFKIWRNNVDGAAKKTAELGANMGGTANALNNMSRMLGMETPSQRSSAIKLGIDKKDSVQINEKIAPILQSEQGLKFIKELKESTSADRFSKLSDYLRSGIAAGMLDSQTASLFAKVVAGELNDAVLGMTVVQSLRGQTKGSKALLDIAQKRESATLGLLGPKDLNQSQRTFGGSSSGRGGGGGGLGGVRTGARVPSMVAPKEGGGSNLAQTDDDYKRIIGASIQIFQDFGNAAALAEEEYQNGTIKFKEYIEIVSASRDAQVKYTQALTDAMQKGSDFGSSMQAWSDQLTLAGIGTEEQDILRRAATTTESFMGAGSVSPLNAIGYGARGAAIAGQALTGQLDFGTALGAFTSGDTQVVDEQKLSEITNAVATYQVSVADASAVLAEIAKNPEGNVAKAYNDNVGIGQGAQAAVSAMNLESSGGIIPGLTKEQTSEFTNVKARAVKDNVVSYADMDSYIASIPDFAVGLESKNIRNGFGKAQSYNNQSLRAVAGQQLQGLTPEQTKLIITQNPRLQASMGAAAGAKFQTSAVYQEALGLSKPGFKSTGAGTSEGDQGAAVTGLTKANEKAAAVFGEKTNLMIIKAQTDVNGNPVDPQDYIRTLGEWTTQAQKINDVIPPEIVKALHIDMTNPEDLKKYAGLADTVAQNWQFLDRLNPNINKMSVFEATMVDKDGNIIKDPMTIVKNVAAVNEAFKKLGSKNSKVRKEAIVSLATSYAGTDVDPGEVQKGLEELRKQYKDFDKLDPIVQNQMLELKFQYNVEGEDQMLVLAQLRERLKNPNLRMGEAEYIVNKIKEIEGMQAAKIEEAYNTKGNYGGGGGGGGSNPLVDFKKSLLEQIRLYADLSMTLKKLFSSKMSFLKLLGSNKGVDDQLRAAGLGEAATQAVMSMGADAAKKWIKANITGGKNPRLKESGKRQEEALLAGAMSQRQSEAVGAIKTANMQRQASTLLASGKYGNAGIETTSAILGDPVQAEGFAKAAKEYDIVQKKVRQAEKKGKSLPSELEKEWKNAQKTLLGYIDKQDKAFSATNIQDQLRTAKEAADQQGVMMSVKKSLSASGTSRDVIDAISSDYGKSKSLYELDEAIAKGKNAKGKGAKALQEAGRQAARDRAQLLADTQASLPDTTLEKNIADLQVAQQEINRPLQKQIDLYQEQINLINKEIEALQRLNDSDQNRIRTLSRQKEMLERQVEAINRKNEADQNSINKLQREDELRTRVADALNHELSLMSEQETKIREAYDKRVKALDEVAKINDYIINQQKNQLGLAQALSQGDVYAAAAAQQTMQTGTAQFAQEQMRSGLQTGMENQVEGLTTSGGLTRVQAEDQIRAIGQQTYQTSLLVRDLQDSIYSRNLDIAAIKIQQRDIDDSILKIQDDIYARETEIIGIQRDRIQPLQDQITKIQEAKDISDKSIQNQIDGYQLQIDQRDMADEQAQRVKGLAAQWGSVAEEIAKANKFAKDATETNYTFKPVDLLPGATDAEKAAQKQKMDDWKKVNENIEAQRLATIASLKANGVAASAAISAPVAAAVTAATKPIAGGQGMMLATGGVVGQGGRDSVPSMLTPGEYVMRKASVQKYGMPMLSRMNMGAFDMPRYDTQQPNITSVQPTSNTSNINAPVYNTYSVNVSANTNASADDIANTVMTKIKRVDSMAVRSFRGY